MSVAGSWVMANGTVPSSPASTFSTLYFDTADGRLKYVANDTFVKPIASNVINSTLNPNSGSGIAHTDTIISNGTSSLHLSANELTAGSLIRIKIIGSCAVSSTGYTQVFTVRYGAAGTTGDTALCTLSVASGTSGTTVFGVELDILATAVGGSGTLTGTGLIWNAGTGAAGGFCQVAATAIIIGGTKAIASNVAGYINVSYDSGGANTTTTFTQCIIECVKA